MFNSSDLFTIDSSTEGVSFSIAIQPEDFDVEDNAFEFTEEFVADVKKRLSTGSMWAWCMVMVMVDWNGWTGVAYLSACSHDSEEDFRNNSGYFESMKQDALDNMNENILEAASRLPIKQPINMVVEDEKVFDRGFGALPPQGRVDKV